VDDAGANLATIWEAIALRAGDAPAVIHGDRVRTWAEFESRAARLAGALAHAGVRPGDKVAICCYNSIEYLETVFAAFKLRAAPVNVNYRYREAELSYLLEDSDARAAVFHAALAARMVPVASGLGRPVVLVAVADGSELPTGPDDYEELVSRTAPASPVVRSGDDELIVYTGGTTGRPKGVIWGHSALLGMQRGQLVALLGPQGGQPAPSGIELPDTVADVAQLAGALARGPRPSATLAASPLMHGTGLFTSLGTLGVGGRVVLCTSRSLDPDEVCRLIGQHRVTTLSMVGDVFGRPILAALDRAAADGHPYDLSSLERISSVGVTWSAEVKQGLLRHGAFTLVDGVAATEGGGFASTETRQGEGVVTSRFRLGPSARVLDEQDRDVVPGSGQVGVLVATGPMPKGYLNDPEKTARTWRVIDGVRYVVPGDMAQVEADGTLVLLGRGSEVVNTGGEKVFVEEVEQAIATHPGVADVLVVGVPDDRFGQRVAAVVATVAGAEVSEREIMDQVGARLADHKRPRQVVFVDEVQRSPSGKANRSWARETVEKAQVG
jgi:3-oxocholest-4-en-26-oate---CoA ligase